MLEAYKAEFIAAVTVAWDSYVERTTETVRMETDLHREIV